MLTDIFHFIITNQAEVISLIIFFFLWGITLHLDKINITKTISLRKHMNRYRIYWINASSSRGVRVEDINTIMVLQHSINFIASISIFIIAGLLTFLFNVDKTKSLLNDYFIFSTVNLEDYKKLFLPIGMFIYAYFKQIWAIRILNISAVLICALPPQTHSPNNLAPNDYSPSVVRAAKTCSLATDQMNRGIKTSYFGFISITWIFGNQLFVLLSVIMFIVLYKLEYNSRVTRILNEPDV